MRTGTLQRMAQASSWSEESRTADVVLSTDADTGDGFELVHTRAAIRWPERPVPVVIDHRREVGAVIGAVSDLALEPLNGGIALVGRLQLDGPAADQAIPLLRTGAARWSIGARIHKSAPVVGTALVQATDWSIGHLALVVEPQDTAAITRSSKQPEPMTTNTNTDNTANGTMERSAKDLKRENAILRIAQAAGINDQEQIDRWVNSDLPADRVSYEAVRAVRIRLEGGDVRADDGPAPLGHPARMHAAPIASHRDLNAVLAAKMGATGEGIDRSLAGVPIGLVLRDFLAGHDVGRDIDVNRAPITRLVDRAWSTSDFSKALEASGERMLLQSYQEAQVGVLALARAVDLPDFRAMEMIRVSQYGELSEKGQGGEYKTAKYAEEGAATLQAAEYGSIAVLTRVALANDNLNIFGELVSEMGRSAARKERSELANRLKNDFTWATANSATTSASDAAGIVTGITNAALKLRRQKDIDGNSVSFEPRLLLVAPEQEAAARQALGTYNPAQAGDVMPFPMLTIQVDHHLAGGVFYVVDTAYPPLVIGRIGGGPITSESEDFDTANRKFRVQLDMGTAKLDQRSLVKVTIGS
jgi:hypothetical protein